MGFNFKTIEQANVSSGTQVLLRLDLNLSIVGGVIRDDFRLRRSLPTLEFLKSRGARTVIVSHTDSKETDSLLLVANYLKKFINLKFVATLAELPAELTRAKPGDFLFLENIRQNPGEITNDPAFAKELATFGEVYVNDAFAVSHRSHASIVGVPKFLPSFAGLLFADEVSHLSKAFEPAHPFVFILAGANKKLTIGSTVSETKFPLVKKFLTLADSVFIGGALANDLFRARGCEIGRSNCGPADVGLSEFLHNPKLLLPADVVAENAGAHSAKSSTDVLPAEKMVDAGPQTLEMLKEKISKAEFVLWNGPLGIYEEGYTEGTESLAKIIAESHAESIVGGGDTLTAIGKLGVEDKFSFVSTGGGAMLDFLANGTLPGIEALEGKMN